MAVEVVTPDDYVGGVMGDLNARRGRVTSIDAQAGAQTIKADVPLREMFGYSTELRSASQGRATYTMEFASYAPVPSTLMEQIVSRAGY